MDLVNGRKRRFRMDRGNGEAAIAFDRFAIVTTPEANVEAFADAD